MRRNSEGVLARKIADSVDGIVISEMDEFTFPEKGNVAVLFVNDLGRESRFAQGVLETDKVRKALELFGVKVYVGDVTQDENLYVRFPGVSPSILLFRDGNQKAIIHGNHNPTKVEEALERVYN